MLADNDDDRHIAINGKTLRASKDGDGGAEHVLSAFCGGLQTILSHEASRGKGLEIPDALKLLARLDLRDRIVTGDAIFCQKAIAQTVVDAGETTCFVKNNQKTLRENIETAFAEPVFPLATFDSGATKAHGRIERRRIEVLPAQAADITQEWPTVSQICRVTRSRQRRVKGVWQEQQEAAYLITSRLLLDSPRGIPKAGNLPIQSPDRELRVRGHFIN